MMPADQERRRLTNIVLFAARVTTDAWGWKNIDEWQRKVLACEDRFVLLNCSRQSGKSSILMVKLLYKALTTPNALCLIVAEQRQSNEDLRKVKELVRAYDKFLNKRYQGKLRCIPIMENITSLEFPNQARIVALPGTEKVRGFSAPDAVAIDEAGYLDDEVFIGIDPMLEVSHGQLILASTPNGTDGFYYRECSNPRYRQFRVPWTECPRISRESIEAKRMLYNDAYVKQEYECEFLEDVTCLFSEKALWQSIDENEDVFATEMLNIQRVLGGEVELI